MFDRNNPEENSSVDWAHTSRRTTNELDNKTKSKHHIKIIFSVIRVCSRVLKSRNKQDEANFLGQQNGECFWSICRNFEFWTHLMRVLGGAERGQREFSTGLEFDACMRPFPPLSTPERCHMCVYVESSYPSAMNVVDDDDARPCLFTWNSP